MRRWTVMMTMILLAAACHDGGTDTPEVAGKIRNEALAPRSVRLVAVEAREEHPTLDLVGEIRADEMVSIPAEVSGQVERVLVEVGDTVHRGQELAAVDRTTYELRLHQAEANVAAAQADLALARKELERKRDLLSDHTISQAAFDQVQAQLDLAAARLAAARAARDLAQRDYDKSAVRAPADGAVAKRMTAPGQWADLGQALIELATGKQVKVAARVPEHWAANLAGLKTLEFRVGTSGEPHSAAVFSIEPVVEGSSRSFEIVGRTADTSGGLRPGMYATVRLTAPNAVTTLWLPQTAVGTSDMPEVMTVEDGHIVVRKVQTGRREQEMVEVVGGLADGEKVVANVAGLARGLPVTLTNGGQSS
ncbi:MAG: efflux RND transporter periplasmic adaptor subunit [Acidobacteria bacterium]|nr:efflux RND transporter periplasmic adaptor subunit [Acidobacteriota bacterium]